MTKIKLYFVGVMMLLITIGSCYIKKEKVENSVLLFNVEALANIEQGKVCLGIGSIDCPGYSNKAAYVFTTR